jgi:hypothetical protein
MIPMVMIRCPKCKQVLQIADELRNKLVRCSACGETLRIAVPESNPVPPAAPSPPAPRPAAPPPAPAPRPTRAKTPADADRREPDLPRRRSRALDLPEQFSELGSPIEEFVPRRWWIGLAISAGFLVVLLPIAILAKSADNQALAIPALILILVAGFLCCALAVLTVMTLKRRVVVCEKGIFIQGLTTTTTCLWNDVGEVVFQMIGIGFSRQVSLRTHDGKQIVLPLAIPRLFRVYSHICEQTMPLLLPPILRALDKGEEVAFGQFIKVTPRGLDWDSKRLSWKKIDHLFWGYLVALKRSALTVRGKQEVGPIDTALVPNVLLLLTVVEQRYQLPVEKATTFFE